MSQAKVHRYKEEKRNRAKIMAKEKREWMLMKIGGAVLALAIVGWAGGSVYYNVTHPEKEEAEQTVEEKPTYTVNTSALEDYLGALELD